MDFWSKFDALCKERGTTPTAVAKALGLSTGLPTGWKKDGKKPSSATMLKLCEFFNVPLSYFYEGKINNVEPVNIEFKKFDEFEHEILNLMKKMSTKQKNALLTKAYEISEQQ